MSVSLNSPALRCPNCNAQVRRLSGHLDSLKCQVGADLRRMAQWGWVPIRHGAHQHAVKRARAPYERAFSAYVEGQRGQRATTRSVMYAPAWVQAVLLGSTAGRVESFSKRADRLIYAVAHDLGDALAAQLSSGQPVSRLIDEHRSAFDG